MAFTDFLQQQTQTAQPFTTAKSLLKQPEVQRDSVKSGMYDQGVSLGTAMPSQQEQVQQITAGGVPNQPAKQDLTSDQAIQQQRLATTTLPQQQQAQDQIRKQSMEALQPQQQAQTQSTADIQRISMQVNREPIEVGKEDQTYLSEINSVGVSSMGLAGIIDMASLQSIKSTAVNPFATDTAVMSLQGVKNYKPEGFVYNAGSNSLVGECAWFVQQITDLGKVGNTLQQKKNSFANYAKQGKAYYKGEETPIPGHAVLTNESSRWGHVALINGITPDGKLILTESNFASKKKVTHSRVIDPNDPAIIGFYKTTVDASLQ